MKIVAIGGRPFVAGLQLAGVEGMEVSSSKEAFSKIKILMEEKYTGLHLPVDTRLYA